MSKADNKHLQMILVKSKNWEAINSQISLYEKKSIKDTWHQVGNSFPAVLGKKGMGWGRGIYDRQDAINNTFRQEGDKRAPAGIFDIGEAFGIASSEQAKKEINLKIPYTYLNDSMRCIGDGNSKYYNTIVDIDQIKKDWANDDDNEKMRYEGLRDEMAYKWGFFINNNVDSNHDISMKRDKKGGSCIFMHIWKDQDTGTSGCTAMEEKNIKHILNWLDNQKNPIVVQLPITEYTRLQAKWDLP
ncbi:MAG: L,D-transpeptidase family protein [Candidatus Sericytochromatia bacterium]|nr:L,D-transpeptidase family protein [Candidatus Sericytochromatia bacterium]